MAIDKQIQIVIDTKVKAAESATSIKELRRAIKDLEDTAIQYGDSSEEVFIKISQEAGRFKDRITDVKEQINSVSASNLENVASGFGRIRSSILNLDFDQAKIGAESLKASLDKTTGSEITSSIKGMISSFGDLAKSILTGSTHLATFGKTLGVITGGAILGGIIAIISNFDKLKGIGGGLGTIYTYVSSVIEKVTKGFKDLGDAIGLTNFKQKEAGEIEKTRSENTNSLLLQRLEYEKKIAQIAGGKAIAQEYDIYVQKLKDLDKKLEESDKKLKENSATYQKNLGIIKDAEEKLAKSGFKSTSVDLASAKRMMDLQIKEQKDILKKAQDENEKILEDARNKDLEGYQKNIKLKKEAENEFSLFLAQEAKNRTDEAREINRKTIANNIATIQDEYKQRRAALVQNAANERDDLKRELELLYKERDDLKENKGLLRLGKYDDGRDTSEELQRITETLDAVNATIEAKEKEKVSIKRRTNKELRDLEISHNKEVAELQLSNLEYEAGLFDKSKLLNKDYADSVKNRYLEIGKFVEDNKDKLFPIIGTKTDEKIKEQKIKVYQLLSTLRGSIETVEDEVDAAVEAYANRLAEESEGRTEKRRERREAEIKSIKDYAERLSTIANIDKVGFNLNERNVAAEAQAQARKVELENRMQQEIEAAEKLGMSTLEIKRKYDALILQSDKQTQEEKLANAANAINKAAEIAQAGSNAIQGVFDLIGQNEVQRAKKRGATEKELLALEKKAFNRNKVVGALNAGISTALGIAKTLELYPTQPVYAGILTAFIGATGLAQIAAILSKQFTGEESGSGSSSVAAIPSFNEQREDTNISAPTLFGLGDVRATNSGGDRYRVYVVESDITATQKNVNRIEVASTF